MAAVKQDYRALTYASDELKNDKEVLMAAVAQDGRALEYASPELKRDKEVVMAAVAQDSRALKYASDELNTEECGEGSVCVLQYASNELKRVSHSRALEYAAECGAECGVDNFRISLRF